MMIFSPYNSHIELSQEWNFNYNLFSSSIYLPSQLILFFRLTDEQLVKICEGRTAHKWVFYASVIDNDV